MKKNGEIRKIPKNRIRPIIKAIVGIKQKINVNISRKMYNLKKCEE
jgi:hypothetical protein